MCGCRAQALHCHGAVVQIHGLNLGFNGHCMFSFGPLSISFLLLSLSLQCRSLRHLYVFLRCKVRYIVFFFVPLFPFYDSLSFFSCPFLKKRCKHILALSLFWFFCIFLRPPSCFLVCWHLLSFRLCPWFSRFFSFTFCVCFSNGPILPAALRALRDLHINLVVLFEWFIPFLKHF